MAETSDRKIEFLANPTQKAFIESRAEADLWDSRKGEGKSAALAWCCYYHTLMNPGAEWLMIRDTWENCRRTTQREFFYWFPPQVIGEYQAGNKEFIWKGEQVGLTGRVTFIGLDAAEDAHKVASMPLGGFGMDEPAPAAGESEGIDKFIFDTAMAQLRQPGLKWYAAKLAQNNADETHWTYDAFWEPGTPCLVPDGKRLPDQDAGFRGHQSAYAENVHNLPMGYYDRLSALWAHRPDLHRRFVEGRHGYQKIGKDITPEFNEDVHLARNLKPIEGCPLILLWDFGLNPTCIITQVTPLGRWLILEAFVGEEIGATQLIEEVVKPALTSRYDGFQIRHIGDPAGRQKEQSDSNNSAVKVIKSKIGGPWKNGAVSEAGRIDPLRTVLTKGMGGQLGAIVQIDRDKAKVVWHSLRGGWHRRKNRDGSIGEVVKNMHSHPGDACGYGASVLFPVAKLLRRPNHQAMKVPSASYAFGPVGADPRKPLGFEQPGRRLPRQVARIGG